MAIVVLIIMSETFMAVASCLTYSFLHVIPATEVCPNLAQTIRETFSEMVAALLAFLLAARRDNYDNNDDDDKED